MRIRGLVVATGVTALLAGCAGVAAEASDPATVWAQHHDDFLSEHGPFPDSDPAYTETEAQVALAEGADTAWASVLRDYPNAARPTEGFVRWAQNDDRLSPEGAFASCLTDHGVMVDVGTTDDGKVGGLGYSADTEEALVGAYFCEWVAFPGHPVPSINAAQLGYIWDAYSEFLLPCLEAGGIPQATLPSRDEWIEEFPRANWSLDYPAEGNGMDELRTICPVDLIH